MDIKVSGRQTTVTDKLRDRIDEKIGGALKVFDIEPMTCDVVLRYEKNPSNPEPAIIEVTVRARGSVIRVAEHGTDMYAAIDKASDKVTRQLRKFKTKVVDRKTRSEKPSKTVETGSIDAIAEEIERDEEVVKVKEIELQPLTQEEALIQMDLLGHDFFVFEDKESGEVQVLYRRHGGGYGLIKTA